LSLGDSHNQEARGRGSLASVAWAVEHLTVQDQFGGAAAIEVNGFLATQFDKELGELGESHAHREPGLTPIHDNEEAVTLIPSERRTRMTFRRTGCGLAGRLAEVNESRASSDGRDHRFQGWFGAGLEDHPGPGPQKILQWGSSTEN
jgi:hypothetical protein